MKKKWQGGGVSPLTPLTKKLSGKIPDSYIFLGLSIPHVAGQMGLTVYLCNYSHVCQIVVNIGMTLRALRLVACASR